MVLRALPDGVTDIPGTIRIPGLGLLDGSGILTSAYASVFVWLKGGHCLPWANASIGTVCQTSRQPRSVYAFLDLRAEFTDLIRAGIGNDPPSRAQPRRVTLSGAVSFM